MWSEGTRESTKSAAERGGQGQRQARENPPDKPKDSPEEPSLSGRVLDSDGNPLVGLAVHARGERLFGTPAVAEPQGDGSAFTDAYGFYALTALADGQYRVSAEADGYARAEIATRTGVQDADLVLHREETIRVYGQITDRSGKPLEGAQVTPNLSPAISVPTDADGLYAVSVSLRERVESFELRVEHLQHLPQSLRLDEASWREAGAVELNVALEPISKTATVVGQLESTTGEAVVGEAVVLYSPSLMRRFEAVSGGDGRFRIAAVEIADDYLVSVRPRGPYQDYTRRNVRVATSTELWIPLEPLENGALSGRMTDVNGNPVPNVTLMLYSASAASRTLPVTGNKRGEYAVADVPFGELVFQTHSFPFFRITNVKLGSDTQEVPLVLDWGRYEVRGRVLDDAGFALAAPEVYLTWSHARGGVRSTAVRRTAADAEGYFRFVGLGAGPHTITVNVPGFRAARRDHNVGAQGREIVLALEPEIL